MSERTPVYLVNTPGVGVALQALHPRGVLIEPAPVSWTIPKEFKGIMNYNPRHDIQNYLDLRSLNGKINPTEYANLLLQTNTRTRRQLEKAIGERFGVERSTVEYFIDKDKRLRSPDYPEPIIERYKKGQKFLAENGSQETERESAEVEGIRHIERIFTDPDFPQNQTVIIISTRGPQGSLYTENFFDVYQKKADIITMTRYHSTHSPEGFLEATQSVDPTYQTPAKDQKLNAAFFLQRPIKSKKALPETLETFALDKTAQKYEINQQIIENCPPFILSYINTLASILDTSELETLVEKIKLTLNAIYNKADETERELMESGDSISRYAPSRMTIPVPIKEQVDHYGRQPVRTVNRGCPGGQKGFAVNQPSFLKAFATAIGAKSVIDFSPFAEDEDTSDFQCPGWKVDPETGKKEKCTYIIRYGSGARKCPECGMEATCG